MIQQFYELNFRIVASKVTDELYETVLTNLNKDVYPPEKLKRIVCITMGELKHLLEI